MSLPFLIGAMSLLGRSGQIAASLEPLEGRTVGIEVRGEDLPGTYVIKGFQPLGAGLWIRLAPVGGGHDLRMKIAQPLRITRGEEAWEITFSGYVQWAGRRLPGPGGRRAPGSVRISPVPGGA
jgi:hypothetical protein